MRSLKLPILVAVASLAFWACDAGDRSTAPAAGRYPDNPPETTQVTRALIAYRDGADPGIRILSPAARVRAGASLQISAEATGLEGDFLVWDVVEGDSRGAISGDLVYTAPLEFPEGATATIRARSGTLPDISATLELELVPPVPPGKLEEPRRLATVGREAVLASDSVMTRIMWVLYLAVEYAGFPSPWDTDRIPLGGHPGGPTERLAILPYDGKRHVGGTAGGPHVAGGHDLVCTGGLVLREAPNGRASFAGRYGDHPSGRGAVLHATVEAPFDPDAFTFPFTRTLSGAVELWGERWDVEIEHSGLHEFGTEDFRGFHDVILGTGAGRPGSFSFDQTLDESQGIDLSTLAYNASWSWSGTSKLLGARGLLEMRDIFHRGAVVCTPSYQYCKTAGTWRASGVVAGPPWLSGRIGLFPDPPGEEPPYLVLNLDGGGVVKLVRREDFDR